MPLFEVAIIQNPTKKEKEDGGQEKLVFGPECVIASDPQTAAIKAVLKGSTGGAIDMDRAEVIVRPFA